MGPAVGLCKSWCSPTVRRPVAKPYRGPPMTLGAAAAAQVRLMVWCKACQHQVEPDPAEMAARYGGDTSVLDWRERLICFRCGQAAGRYSRDRDQATTG
jgi:hypothetical protein